MKYWVVGYYGYGNTGDDDLLTQTIKVIRSADTAATISIAFPIHPRSPLPQDTHPIHRFSPYQVIRAVWNADAVIFGGGGIFQDQTSIQSLLYYVSIVMLAASLRRPVFLLGQGISKPKRKISGYLIKLALARCHWIGCRDHESLAELRKMLTPKAGTLTADLAFAFRTATLHPGHRPYVALSVRHPNQPLNWAPLQHFINHSSYPIIGLSFEAPQDDLAIQYLFDTTTKTAPSIIAINTQFPKADLASGVPELVIAMRYHACVWAALNGIPFLAIAYDDKVIAIAQELGQPVMDLRHTNPPPSLSIAVAAAIQNQASLKAQLCQTLPGLSRRALINQEGISDFVRDSGCRNKREPN